jgi:NAD(P)-dependent dehydrogenase (short-subunit alcohol dehydrogenase family)
MSVAVVQGCSGALGSALTRHILKNTSLKVYGLTHRADVENLRERLGGSNHGDRLTVIEGVDLKGEDGLERASKTINEREGKNVRLVACLAGIVSLWRDILLILVMLTRISCIRKSLWERYLIRTHWIRSASIL